MKRRAKPLVWLFPLFASVLVYFLVRIFSPRPTADIKLAEGPAVRITAPRTPPLKGKEEAPGPKAAIIIDDIGYNLEAVEAAYAIGKPLTLAILPDASRTGDAARLASACGLEIMLHLPFESAAEKRGTKAFKGTISAGMSPDDIRAAVARALDRVPGAAGVNNHTGSSATEETRLMRPVFEILKSRGLYFVDSRTTAETVAHEEAVRAGVRSVSRNVFLDADPEEARIEARLRELFSLAKKHGRAVGICHAKRESLAALARHIGLADAFGVRLVFASAIVE